MDFKKLLIPVMLVMMIATASATVTVATIEPDGDTYFPNRADDFIDVQFTVVDDNIANSIHTVTIQFNQAGAGDANTFVALDQNIGADECTDGNNWFSGQTCLIKFTFPVTTGTKVITGTYVMDINVLGTAPHGGHIAAANDVTIFVVDNRFIGSDVEALLNVLPIVLIAAVLIGVVLLFAGIIGPQTALIGAIAAVIGVIAVIVLVEITKILTP